MILIQFLIKNKVLKCIRRLFIAIHYRYVQYQKGALRLQVRIIGKQGIDIQTKLDCITKSLTRRKSCFKGELK